MVIIDGSRSYGRVGKMFAVDRRWPSEIRDDTAAYELFLQVGSPARDRAVALVLFALDAALLALFGSWIVRRLRRSE